MPSLTRKEKITCENCGTQTSKNNSVRHKKRCLVRTLYCPIYFTFSTRSQADLKYNIAKKHNSSQPKKNHQCQFCHLAVFIPIETTQTEGAQRKKCIGDQKCGCDTVRGRD